MIYKTVFSPQTHIVFELLDTVEFLSILFINEDQLLVSFEVENAIIAYSCINLIMPAVALFQVKYNISIRLQ